MCRVRVFFFFLSEVLSQTCIIHRLLISTTSWMSISIKKLLFETNKILILTTKIQLNSKYLQNFMYIKCHTFFIVQVWYKKSTSTFMVLWLHWPALLSVCVYCSIFVFCWTHSHSQCVNRLTNGQGRTPTHWAPIFRNFLTCWGALPWLYFS